MLRRARADDRSSIAQGDEATFQIRRKLKPPGRSPSASGGRRKGEGIRCGDRDLTEGERHTVRQHVARDMENKDDCRGLSLHRKRAGQRTSGQRLEFVDGPGGRRVKIKDIDGLHEAIGRQLITEKKNLSGKEIRFLRQEMLMSQATLAKLFEVAEQTVLRWEKGKADIPKPAETLVRLLYREHIKDKGAGGVRSKLERLADLEDRADGYSLRFRQSSKGWLPESARQAA